MMKKSKRKGKNYRKAKYIVYKQTNINPIDHLWTFLGGFVGIGILAFLQSSQLSTEDTTFLIGSFGASAVLVYGAPNSPLAQPRNLIGGHILSAIIGVCVYKLIPNQPNLFWLSCALAVSLSIVVMQITKTMHPPGGATALIANIGSAKITGLGFLYVLNPVLSGAVILFVIALIFNNIAKHRTYPTKKISLWK